MAIYTFISHAVPPRIDAAELAFIEWVSSNSLLLMSKAREFLREVTPIRTGYMRSQVATWGFRRYGLGGFRFNLGWRKVDFPGTFYPPYVDIGTGIYGPNKTPIVPRKAARLVWERDGRMVSAKSVQGQRGKNMIQEASRKTYEWMLQWMRSGKINAYRRVIK